MKFVPVIAAAFLVAILIAPTSPRSQTEASSPSDAGASPGSTPEAGPNSFHELLQNSKSEIETLMQMLEQDEPVDYERLSDLQSEFAHELDGSSASIRVQDMYYDVVGALDQATEGLRQQSRISAIAGLASADSILEELIAAIGETDPDPRLLNETPS